MSGDVRQLLDRLDELQAAAATPRPWAATDERADGGAYIDAATRGADSFHVLGVGHAQVAADATLIVAAVNASPQMTAALRAALDLLDRRQAKCIDCRQGYTDEHADLRDAITGPLDGAQAPT